MADKLKNETLELNGLDPEQKDKIARAEYIKVGESVFTRTTQLKDLLEREGYVTIKRDKLPMHSVRASALEKLLKHIDYCNAAMDECKELEYDKEKIRINGQKEGLQAAIDILEHLP